MSFLLGKRAFMHVFILTFAEDVLGLIHVILSLLFAPAVRF